MKYCEIARFLNRKENTVWLNYSRAKKKLPTRFVFCTDDICVPLDSLVSSKTNIFESLVVYLRDFLRLSNKRAAEILKTSEAVASTAYRRARSKNG